MDQNQLSPAKPLTAPSAPRPPGDVPLPLTEWTPRTATSDRPQSAQVEPRLAAGKRFRRIWGPAVVALGMGFTAAWVILVGYCLLTLMGLAI